ncbi:DUF58 domain-containing protein [Knoellia subterranea]|uniref:DUF58 domain-containing protein n=1 Tax=Knoellia subterranea KCTC 19937 TaxID=1385521 RepID=A0A0A0JIU4_9MICO|nr:DUF58 domain-containing protein [Knoellia subterranea]KGN35561.1 hypothetical protein N803_06515 [Knoellia subterranea KCTC 19937]
MALTLRALWLVLLGIIPVVLRPAASTVWLWLLLCAVIVGIDVLLAPRPHGLELARTGATSVRLGESTTTTLLVGNPGPRTARGVLRDAWPPSTGAASTRHTLRLSAGERRRVTTELTPTRRGDRIADRVTVRHQGPLGVGARQSSLEVPGRLRVLHPFPSRRHIPSRLAVLRQLDGRAAMRVRGQGTEFDSLRDYVEGDDVRSIDWRATARRRDLVVRTWQPEQHRRIVIVLDTSRTSAGRIGDAPRLDAAMDAALFLTAIAGHARDRVHVIAGDRRVRTHITGHDRGRLLHDTISELAPIEAEIVEADWRMLAAEVTRTGTQRALVVLITPLESSALEEGLLPVLPALAARHRVVVAAVADPAVDVLRRGRGTATDVYAAAAAERTVSLRDRTAGALRGLGVEVLHEPPEVLPLALVDHYLSLKRQGLL